MPTPSGTTPVYSFPYLLETDVPDIATASEDLALAVEAQFRGIAPGVGTLRTQGLFGTYAGEDIFPIFGELAGTTNSVAVIDGIFPNGGFPNGVLAIVPIPLNNSASGIVGYSFMTLDGSVTKTAFGAQIYYLGYAPALGTSEQVNLAISSGIGINYIAWGY